jgi:hypothetical protein
LSFVNIIFFWEYFYYWNINLSHPLWIAIDFNTFSNQVFATWQNLEFLIWFYIIYNGGKSTWSNFNYLHDDIWTNENLTNGIQNNFLWKLNFYWNFDLNHPLWLFSLYVFLLWHVAQLKVVTWHIDWILEFFY